MKKFKTFIKKNIIKKVYKIPLLDYFKNISWFILRLNNL